MIHNKIHIISPSCLRPMIVLQYSIVALNTNNFINFYLMKQYALYVNYSVQLSTSFLQICWDYTSICFHYDMRICKIRFAKQASFHLFELLHKWHPKWPVLPMFIPVYLLFIVSHIVFKRPLKAIDEFILWHIYPERMCLFPFHHICMTV